MQYYGVQIQPTIHVLDDADYAALTRQHALDHTDHTDQEIYLPCLADLLIDHTDHTDHTDHLSEV